MHPHITIITLAVTDLQKSTAFYQQGLGLQKMNDLEGISSFEMGGILLGLYPRDKLAEDIGIPDGEKGNCQLPEPRAYTRPVKTRLAPGW